MAYRNIADPNYAQNQRNPRNWMERYGSLGQVIKEYVGPNQFVGVEKEELPQMPGTNLGAARGKSFMPGSSLVRTDDTGTPQSNTIFGNYQQKANTNITPIQQKAQQDYDRMMQLYQGLLNKTSGSTLRDRLQSMKPVQESYDEDRRLTGSITDLEDLARTGGYTDEGIADLRERGLSPIRAIYANAQRGLERNKSLQGGYSPNMNAASIKMAREMSDLISGKTTDINAEIAGKVAEGKQKIAPQLTEALLNIQRERGDISERNAGARNRSEEFNRDIQLKQQGMDKEGRNQELEIINSMRSLFGTNPAMADAFIDQILKQGDQNQRGGSTLIDAYLRGVRG